MKSLSTFNSRVLLLCLSIRLDLHKLRFTSCSVCRVPVDFQVDPASTWNRVSCLKPYVAVRGVVPVQASWADNAAKKASPLLDLTTAATGQALNIHSPAETIDSRCDFRHTVSIVAHSEVLRSIMCL